MLTKLRRYLYDEAAFDAFRASVVRFGVALVGILIARPPEALAAWIGTHATAGMVLSASALLIAAGNKIGGYGGGRNAVALKRELLAREGVSTLR